MKYVDFCQFALNALTPQSAKTVPKAKHRTDITFMNAPANLSISLARSQNNYDRERRATQDQPQQKF